MSRLDQDRVEKLQPTRMSFAKNAITYLGYEITSEDATKLQFVFKGETVTLYAYSGWHTGKSIVDGRGIKNLLKQIKP